MGTIGNGYGSECHLLRYLGRHRNELDEQVKRAVGFTEIQWLDFPFDRKKAGWPDAELKGLDFLPSDHPALAKWKRFWPQTGNSQNWDAVARIKVDGQWEWLLVEAKAHVGELKSNCGAKTKGGRPKIRNILSKTKEALGVKENCDWLNGYYQYCNRIAVLNFLVDNKVPSRLLFVYFTGDKCSKSRICPKSRKEWEKEIEAVEAHVGIPPAQEINQRIHKLFLDVKGSRDPAKIFATGR